MKFLDFKLISWLATAAVIGLLTYGGINFPSAPIHPCGLEYCGKHGAKVTRDVYEAFVTWERSLFILIAVSTLFSLARWLVKKSGVQ